MPEPTGPGSTSPAGSADLSTFVRALLAIELGDFGPATRLFAETSTIAGDPA
ncbi:DUF6420 family protein [Streptomyces flaveolus]|uniref:DUF6420 family protein n=1 Tax=Streptomyces flaveolus TaxID=67297 RepID=UPI0033A1734F